MRDKWYILSVVARWLLGAVFIFSGFIKCVDPVGTSIIVEKYLASYSFTLLMPASLGLAIALSVVEVALGIMLVVGVLRYWVSFLAMRLMVLFLFVTLLAATLLPIGDCGCFGEMIKFTPWGSVLKNVVLLAIAAWVWHRSDIDDGQSTALRTVTITAVALLLPLAVNFVALRYLPLVDFMPYKEGVNLREEVTKERESASVRSILIFNNTATGETVEYPSDATECWLNPDLEYVDARTVTTTTTSGDFADFALFDSEGVECTMELLNIPGRVAWLCINDVDALRGERLEAVHRLMEAYPEEAIVVLVASESDKERVCTMLGTTPYIIDRMTLRSMMRAKVGVVVLNSGVIEAKLNTLAMRN